MDFHFEIAIEAGAWPEEALLADLARDAAAALDATLGLANGTTEVSLLFTDDPGIRALNRQWRGKDAATNVLSFPVMQLEPGDLPGPLAGDIAFGFETIEREATIDDKAFKDHLVHLTVHGLMHLLGYDHENEEDAEKMERLETEILGRLGIADPYGSGPGEPASP